MHREREREGRSASVECKIKVGRGNGWVVLFEVGVWCGGEGMGRSGMLVSLVAGRSSRWQQWPTQHNVILVHYPCKLLSVHNNKSFTSKITIFDPYTGLPVTGEGGRDSNKQHSGG